jgi:RNA polymerase sigma factor (TIGR02999 family)
MESRSEISRILIDWDKNPEAAIERLTPLIYSELRKLAAQCLRRERSNHTLQPTALVHEAWMRLVDQDCVSIKNRAHFFGIAARLMRQVLVDSARRRGAEKRGSGHIVQLDADLPATEGPVSSLLSLNQALERLKNVDARKCQVLDLRFFGGLEREEIADVLGVSLATVKRDLTLGLAFLRGQIA